MRTGEGCHAKLSEVLHRQKAQGGRQCLRTQRDTKLKRTGPASVKATCTTKVVKQEKEPTNEYVPIESSENAYHQSSKEFACHRGKQRSDEEWRCPGWTKVCGKERSRPRPVGVSTGTRLLEDKLGTGTAIRRDGGGGGVLCSLWARTRLYRVFGLTGQLATQ